MRTIEVSASNPAALLIQPDDGPSVIQNSDLTNTIYLGFTDTIQKADTEIAPLAPNASIAVSGDKKVYAISGGPTVTVFVYVGGIVPFRSLTQGLGSLAIPSVHSPNYIPGNTGWTINQDGSVEFNNGTFRGTVSAATIIGALIESASSGTRITIDSSGNLVGYNSFGAVIFRLDISRDAFFWYEDTGSATQGALGVSIAITAGVDPFGTTYHEGINTYGGTTFSITAWDTSGNRAYLNSGSLDFQDSLNRVLGQIFADTGGGTNNLVLIADPALGTSIEFQSNVSIDLGKTMTADSWHPLGALGITGMTINQARYRMTVEGELEVDFSFSTTAAVSAQFATFANTLPPLYQPANERACALGASGAGWTISSTRLPSLLVTPSGSVQISIPAIASGVTGGCTARFALT